MLRLSLIVNIAGTLLFPRQESVWMKLISSLEKIIMMNVELFIAFQDWTVKKLLKGYRFVSFSRSCYVSRVFLYILNI